MLSPRQIFFFRGHPTAPGQRDYPGVSKFTNTPVPSGNLAVLPMGSDKYTRDGKPGVPRYVAPYPRDMHADPGSLSAFVGQPKNENVVYRGEIPGAGFEPWNSRNEKLRRSLIEATQNGAG